MHNLPQTEWKETSLEIDNKISRKEVIHWDDENRTGLDYNRFSCCCSESIMVVIILDFLNTSRLYSRKTNKVNFTQWYLLLQMLYMFQAVPPPIIRSSKL